MIKHKEFLDNLIKRINEDCTGYVGQYNTESTRKSMVDTFSKTLNSMVDYETSIKATYNEDGTIKMDVTFYDVPFQEDEE
jgi:hypothetical protein